MEKKAKLVFINRFFYPDQSATSQLLGDLAFYLARSGYDVNVIASQMPHIAGGDLLPKQEVINGVSVHRVRSPKSRKHGIYSRLYDYLFFYIASINVIRKVVEKDSYVIAKTDPPMISIVAFPIVKLKQAKLINWVQDMFPEVAEALGVGFGARAIKGLRNVTLKSAVCNVVIGERMRRRIVDQGVQPSCIRVIPNWVEDDVSKVCQEKVDRLRADWGITGKFVVAYSGNFGRVHKFDSVITVMEKLQGEDSIMFLFIGHGVQYEAVRKKILAKKTCDVKFLPFQPREKLSTTLAVADVHLVTLLKEMEGLVLPSKIYGIAAVGRPAIFIGDPEGDIGDMLKTGNCGYSYDPGDADSLAVRIIDLSRNPRLVKQLGASAKEYFRYNYRSECAFRKWTDVIGDV